MRESNLFRASSLASIDNTHTQVDLNMHKKHPQDKQQCSIPESCSVVCCTLILDENHLVRVTDWIVGRFCQHNSPSLQPTLMQVLLVASSIQLWLFCKSHQFLQKRQLVSMYRHYYHKPCRDQDRQDTEEENLGCSPPKLQGGPHLDLFQQLLILWEVQTWISSYVAPTCHMISNNYVKMTG